MRSSLHANNVAGGKFRARAIERTSSGEYRMYERRRLLRGRARVSPSINIILDGTKKDLIDFNQITCTGLDPFCPTSLDLEPELIQPALPPLTLSGMDLSFPQTPPRTFSYPTPTTPSVPYLEYNDSIPSPQTPILPFNSFPTQSLGRSTVPANSSDRSRKLRNNCFHATQSTQIPSNEGFVYDFSEPMYQADDYCTNIERTMPDIDDEGLDGIQRHIESLGGDMIRMPSPPMSDSSAGSEAGQLCLTAQHLQLNRNSSELLMLRFDRDTCGILSVKNGQNENPWRTMVWPLAKTANSPALYHALHAMSAFHASSQSPSLQVEGMSHMQKSLQYLRNGIQSMSMCTETALATTLALAFSVSWDQHTLTGAEHLRGASALVDDVVVKFRQTTVNTAESARLRFLCNTWIYMDVLARITSMDGCASNDYQHIITPLQGPIDDTHEIDPLMGCASTLFPLIGRVANLVRQVRERPRNSIKIISTATELKEAIQGWVCPTSVEAPEDPDCAIFHGQQTAEAYRWATLLYLHQAVPEAPSRNSKSLAFKVLECLATVPSSSRALIVHIYPLLAAGCEFGDDENREWVKARWAHMMQRMLIGNIDRCWEVTKEVWKRRDAKKAEEEDEKEHRRAMSRRSTGFMVPVEQLRRKFRGADSEGSATSESESVTSKRRSDDELYQPQSAEPSRADCTDTVENLHPDETVKGRLHWLGVMKDWKWEGKRLNSLPNTSQHADAVQCSSGESWFDAFSIRSYARRTCSILYTPRTFDSDDFWNGNSVSILIVHLLMELAAL